MSETSGPVIDEMVMNLDPDNLSRDRALPLHAQIAAHLRQLIHAGMLPNGSRLPAEGDLTRQFRVARGTIRAAMSTLIEEGLIDRDRVHFGAHFIQDGHDLRAGFGVFAPRRVNDYRVWA